MLKNPPGSRIRRLYFIEDQYYCFHFLLPFHLGPQIGLGYVISIDSNDRNLQEIDFHSATVPF